MTLTGPPQAGSAATEQKACRPVITIDPGMCFGAPQIHGITTEAVAGMVRAGEDFATVAEDYGLSRHEVVLACWYEGTAGAYRLEWRSWTNRVARQLGGWEPLVVDAIEEPPVKEER